MKRSITRLTAALLCLLVVPVVAEQKFGTIDLKKVFDGYWRTKSYSEQLKNETAESSQELERRTVKLRAEFEAYRKTAEELNNPSLPKDQLDKNQARLAQRADELRESEKDLNTKVQQARELLAQRQDNAKAKVMEDIRKMVAEKGKTGGYDMVFDTSGGTSNGAPLLMFHNGKNDLSDAVLTQLNANAPTELIGGDAKPDARAEKALPTKAVGAPVSNKP